MAVPFAFAGRRNRVQARCQPAIITRCRGDGSRRERNMEIQVVSGDVTFVQCDALIVNLFEGVQEPGGATGAIDRALDGQIGALIRAGEIKGKVAETTVIHCHGRLPAERVIVAGLGRREDFSLEVTHKAAGAAARTATRKGCRRLASILHGAGAGMLDAGRAAQAVVEGVAIGVFDVGAYKTADREPSDVETLTLIESDASKARQARAGVKVGEITAEATNYARKLVNEPANELSPEGFAQEARRVAEEQGLECAVLGPKELEKQGFGGIMAVGKGSARPPQLITLRYSPRKRGPTLAFIGKGVMFDSGGISLKPSENMELMKGDMAGAAAVLAAIEALSKLKAKVNIMGVIPAVENLPSGSATRPGDVAKMYGGKTVEIVNTDAEGRLILADALAYAREQGATHMVDVATLTAAVVIALGRLTYGVLGNDEELVKRVKDAAAAAGEKAWELPLFPEYREQIKSPIADIKNTGGRPAGPITAALFLKEFVDGTPWVHLDIAGTYWNESDVSYMPKGPTGSAVRTLIELARWFGE